MDFKDYGIHFSHSTEVEFMKLISDKIGINHEEGKLEGREAACLALYKRERGIMVNLLFQLRQKFDDSLFGEPSKIGMKEALYKLMDIMENDLKLELTDKEKSDLKK